MFRSGFKSLTRLVCPHSGVDVLELCYMFTPSSAFSSTHPVNDAPQPQLEEVRTFFHPNTPHLQGDDPHGHPSHLMEWNYNPHDSFTSLFKRLISSWQFKVFFCSLRPWIYTHTHKYTMNGILSLDCSLHGLFKWRYDGDTGSYLV